LYITRKYKKGVQVVGGGKFVHSTIACEIEDIRLSSYMQLP